MWGGWDFSLVQLLKQKTVSVGKNDFRRQLLASISHDILKCTHICGVLHCRQRSAREVCGELPQWFLAHTRWRFARAPATTQSAARKLLSWGKVFCSSPFSLSVLGSRCCGSALVVSLLCPQFCKPLPAIALVLSLSAPELLFSGHVEETGFV